VYSIKYLAAIVSVRISSLQWCIVIRVVKSSIVFFFFGSYSLVNHLLVDAQKKKKNISLGKGSLKRITIAKGVMKRHPLKLYKPWPLDGQGTQLPDGKKSLLSANLFSFQV
jgi:hypothetical protein